MAWVKNQKTDYFCGCAPCPLCFDWVDDQKIEDKIVQVVVAGIDKMIEDITGKPAAEATAREKELVKKIGDDMHERNLKGEKPPELPPLQGQEYLDQEETRWFNKSITEKRKALEATAAYEEQLNKPPTLDALADQGKWAEKGKDGALESEKIEVEVSPGRVLQMTPAEYERYKESVMSGR